MTVSVFINDIPYNIDKAYDYMVPQSLESSVLTGIRVIVPFGGGNRKKEAIITDVKHESLTSIKLKPVLKLIDVSPLIGEKELALASFAKERYFCTFYEALRLLLPPGSAVRFEEYICISSGGYCPHEYLKSKKYGDLIAYISKNGGRCTVADIYENFEDAGRKLKKLINDGVIVKSSDYRADIVDKLQKNYRLLAGADKFQEKLQIERSDNVAKYSRVYSALDEISCLTLKELCLKARVSGLTVSNMTAKGYIEEFCTILYPETFKQKQDEQIISLTPSQSGVFEKLKKTLDLGKASCSLLKGVTGSGKTHVFIHLIDYALKNKKSVLVLIPEIMLTPQIVEKFFSAFGDVVGVMNSSMTQRQRYDTWRRIKNGEIRVVVGTRMAVFAPLDQLGLIIIDEEQDGAYKSERSPRYDARDIAKYRCNKENCPLVLSSATPSITSYNSALSGKHGLFELKERYNKTALPSVEVVDMNIELKSGGGQLFSERLKTLLHETLAQGNQSILFLNRRGYSQYMTCAECGENVMCPNCSVTMTHHVRENMLICHYCAYEHPIIKKCPSCGSEHMRYIGAGTQKIEDELEKIIPKARVLRLDADTIGSREQGIKSFLNKEADILVGTQMISKGLDFPDVTLVGVLNADTSLSFDDYRAGESTFCAVTQVIGRSGRGQRSGRAVLQTYSPDSHIIKSASKQDYEDFYRREIEYRRIMHYPPFKDICLINISASNEDILKKKSQELCLALRNIIVQAELIGCTEIIGPAPSPVMKISGRYRYRIILKCENQKKLRDALSHFQRVFYKMKYSRFFTLSIDINPYNML